LKTFFKLNWGHLRERSLRLIRLSFSTSENKIPFLKQINKNVFHNFLFYYYNANKPRGFKQQIFSITYFEIKVHLPKKRTLQML